MVWGQLSNNVMSKDFSIITDSCLVSGIDNVSRDWGLVRVQSPFLAGSISAPKFKWVHKISLQKFSNSQKIFRLEVMAKWGFII